MVTKEKEDIVELADKIYNTDINDKNIDIRTSQVTTIYKKNEDNVKYI